MEVDASNALSRQIRSCFMLGEGMLTLDPRQHQWDTHTFKIEVPGDTAAHRIDQTASSSAVHRSSGDVQYVQWALAVYEGVIHVLRATLRAGCLEALGTKAFWTGAAVLPAEVSACIGSLGCRLLLQAQLLLLNYTWRHCVVSSPLATAEAKREQEVVLLSGAQDLPLQSKWTVP